MNERRDLLIALNAAARITRAALCRLALSLEAWHEAAAASPALAARLGVPIEQLRRAIAVRARAAEDAGRELERARRAGCEIDTLGDPAYPPQLGELALPPPVLYRRGTLDQAPVAAIVGSRKMDGYGREAAESFAAGLAAAGVTVASGFARGIDSAAHRAALAAGGRTIAVLGCGLDVDYPRRQSRLKDEIAANGAVLSELPLGAEPRPWHFPIRNRLLAALASTTLVVQAKERSGSLITAHHAMELGRDVYAVPGRIFDDLSLGTNSLLADGAFVARCPEDILVSFSLAGHQQTLFPFPGEGAETKTGSATQEDDTAQVVESLPEGAPGKLLEAFVPGRPQTAEDVAGRLELPVDQVLGTLLELELGGWVRREPGPVYVR